MKLIYVASPYAGDIEQKLQSLRVYFLRMNH